VSNDGAIGCVRAGMEIVPLDYLSSSWATTCCVPQIVGAENDGSKSNRYQHMSESAMDPRLWL
jgi:hypothetical protein